MFRTIYDTFLVLGRYPRTLMPFFLLALVQGGVLVLCYLFPQAPVSKFLAPVVRAFMGEKFLHYPLNFFVLPTLFHYGNMVVSCFPGMIFNAIHIGMIRDAHEQRDPEMRAYILPAFKAFFALTIIWILSVLAMKGLTQVLQPILADQTSARMQFVAIFLAGFLIQILFVYAFPAIVIGQCSFLKALIKGLVKLLKNLISTTLIFFLGGVVLLPVVYATSKPHVLVARLFPESVAWILGLMILAMFVVNWFLTTYTTITYIKSETNLPQSPQDVL